MLKHQSIIDAFKVKMQLIKTLGGYYTNAGNNVWCWRDTPLQDTETPGIVYRDGVDSPYEEFIKISGDIIYHKLPVEIDLVCNDAATARKLIADCQKAINTDRTLAGLTFDIEYGGFGLIAQEQNEKLISGAQGIVYIIYQTGKFKEE